VILVRLLFATRQQEAIKGSPDWWRRPAGTQ